MHLDLLFPTPVWSTFLNYDSSKLLSFYKTLDKTHGRSYSNEGGYQSQDFTKHDNNILLEFSNLVEKETAKACEDFGINPLEIKHLWFNGNSKGDTNKSHIHGGSILSGVYYVDVDDDSGEIMFHRNTQDEMYFGFAEPHNVNTLNACSIGLKPLKDKLVIFPSNLMHSVTKNNSDKERISVSFNLGPKNV